MTATGITTYKNYIGGAWTDSDSGKTYPITNPASKSSVIGEFQTSGAADALRAAEEAHKALAGWAETPAPSRAAVLFRALDIMRRRSDELARTISVDRRVNHVPVPGVAVLCAGTADLPVAHEAVITAELIGCGVERIFDVGVAGLHRLLGYLPVLRKSTALVVVAGMEGALPSVVGGLVNTPIIAVPTSVGYGASFDGLAALLGMLNSCAPGVGVVNIDNGFGAGYLAATINMGASHD